MRRCRAVDLRPGDVAVLGVPWDEQSSFLRGARHGPAHIRGGLASPSTNWSTEGGRDLAIEPRLVDVGDVELATGLEALATITAAATAVLRAGASLVALGGDHAITYPLLKAIAAQHGPPAVLHLDAHPDTYEVFEGNRYSHACPFARILEDRLATSLVQVGIRTSTPHQREQAMRYGVRAVEMRQWTADLSLSFDGPVYLSLDLDVLDPAFAPGVSHHEPGGASVRDVLRVIQGFRGRLVGADIVECNPGRDIGGVTGMVAAKFVKEIVDRLLVAGDGRADT